MRAPTGSEWGQAKGLSVFGGEIHPVAENPQYPFEFNSRGWCLGMNDETLIRYRAETAGRSFPNPNVRLRGER